MRRYIRHPVDIPIEYEVQDKEGVSASAPGQKRLHNLSCGGLRFSTNHPLRIGSQIRLQIPCGCSPVYLEGEVRWCHGINSHFEVGVAFDDPQEEFRLRMVEQLCYIDHYQREVEQREGRHLSREEAAGEWIEKYAGSFPH